MSLSNLISDIKKEQKINNDALITLLTEAIENEDDEMCTYKAIYKKAYGEHLTEAICKDWVKRMAVTDNSDRVSGEKWTVEQTTDIGQKIGVNWNVFNKWEWYAMMNASYSDHYKTAKEYELDTEPDFFASLVIDTFCDIDAHNKTPFTYYFTFAV